MVPPKRVEVEEEVYGSKVSLEVEVELLGSWAPIWIGRRDERRGKERSLKPHPNSSPTSQSRNLPVLILVPTLTLTALS